MRFSKSYDPKPLDPGQPFDAVDLVGVVWSDGPVASSRWILCDDGELRAVKLSKGVPVARLQSWDNWRERAAEVALSPWLDQQYRRVK